MWLAVSLYRLHDGSYVPGGPSSRASWLRDELRLTDRAAYAEVHSPCRGSDGSDDCKVLQRCVRLAVERDSGSRRCWTELIVSNPALDWS
jgi:hypothetical protein